MSRSGSIRSIVFAVAAVACWATVTGVAGARSSSVCGTVAPSTAALAKALGASSFAPISYPGTPAYCGVGGAGPVTARIYLYSKSAASRVAPQLAASFGQRAARKQTLAGLGSGATLEYVPGDTTTVIAFFTAGSHFIVIVGSEAKNAQVVALARAVHAKLA